MHSTAFQSKFVRDSRLCNGIMSKMHFIAAAD